MARGGAPVWDRSARGVSGAKALRDAHASGAAVRMARGAPGLTLVELLVVLSIFAALLLVLGASFQGWMAKYKVEDDTKRIFAALSAARLQAMQKKRIYFVVIDNATFRAVRTYEDTDPAPDGDGARSGPDTLRDTVTTSYTIAPSFSGGATEFFFDRDGVPNVSGTISLVSSFSPDYDCIRIDTTRIKMGHTNGGTCLEK